MNYNTPESCTCACCAEYSCHCRDYPESEQCDCFLCLCALGKATPGPRDTEAVQPLKLDPPKTAREFWNRLRDFCRYDEEDINAMTDEEVSQYLAGEGIDVEPTRERLRTKLAEIREAQQKEGATK